MDVSFEIKNCSIRWRLRITSYSRTVESPKFLYGSSQYCLGCHTLSQNVGLVLVKKNKESNALPSGVTVRVENPNTDKFLPSLTGTRLSLLTYDLCIWSKPISEIEAACPEFSRSRELTFVVTFPAEQSLTCTDEKDVQTSTCIDPIPSYESLSADWAKFLDSDTNFDVDFQCGGQSTMAHRLVVSARSPVLAKMLQSQMVEDTTGIIKIEDLDLDTLRLFVRFLYTGRLAEAPTFEMAMALYEVADKYQVQSLARRCAESLVEGLTVENACNVLDVADRHSDERFVEEVIVFILKKKVPSTSDHWRAFCSSHPMLANEVLNRFIEASSFASSPAKKRHCASVTTEQQ